MRKSRMSDLPCKSAIGNEELMHEFLVSYSTRAWNITRAGLPHF